MDIELTNKTILGVFFLYLVILGGDIQSVLNCNLQKLLKNNIFVIHGIVFISIFIFTFILNWYTPGSLVLKEGFNMLHNESKYKYLYDSFFNTIGIYVLFVLSTRQEVMFMYSSIALIFISIFMYIILKIEFEHIGVDFSDLNKKLFITNKDISTILKKKEIEVKGKTDNIVYFYNILKTFYLLIVLNILTGVFLYYKRQSKEHSKDWSMIKFIFGRNKCDNIIK
jgi:hypothetical protein